MYDAVYEVRNESYKRSRTGFRKGYNESPQSKLLVAIVPLVLIHIASRILLFQ